MAMTPEGRVKNVVRKLFFEIEQTRDLKIYQFWPVPSGYGASSLDCIGCINGKFFSVETKAPGKHPTERQKLTIDAMRAASGRVFVVGEKLEGGVYSGYVGLRAWLQSA